MNVKEIIHYFNGKKSTKEVKISLCNLIEDFAKDERAKCMLLKSSYEKFYFRKIKDFLYSRNFSGNKGVSWREVIFPIAALKTKPILGYLDIGDAGGMILFDKNKFDNAFDEYSFTHRNVYRNPNICISTND